MHVHERGTSIEINCVTGTSPFNTQKKNPLHEHLLSENQMK